MKRKAMEVREMSPEYDLTAASPAVPVGYKQTEVGVIPDDWNVSTIGAMNPFVTSGSRGWARYYRKFGALFVRITNMNRENIQLDLTDSRFVYVPDVGQEGARTSLAYGDVLISITADIGIIGYIDQSVPLPAYINQHIALVRLSNKKIHPKFVALFLAFGEGQRRFNAITDQGAKAGINLNTVRELPIAFPYTVKEQENIANALSDVDALLEELDRLIAKKRDIKQATMQQLLTGQTRLPGFEGEWSTKPLIDYCGLKSGEAITSSSITSHSKYPCYGGNGLRGYVSRFTHEGDYALIGRQGALCGNVVQVSGSFFASEHALVVTAYANTDINWLAAILKRMNLNQYSESSAQPGLSAKKLSILEVYGPISKAEQKAIAAILYEMDHEIEALEHRRSKTTNLKKGMMQELLTGRCRLKYETESSSRGCK